jgi:hypothetical protein
MPRAAGGGSVSDRFSLSLVSVSGRLRSAGSFRTSGRLCAATACPFRCLLPRWRHRASARRSTSSCRDPPAHPPAHRVDASVRPRRALPPVGSEPMQQRSAGPIESEQPERVVPSVRCTTCACVRARARACAHTRSARIRANACVRGGALAHTLAYAYAHGLR